jgi:hypothetical protein
MTKIGTERITKQVSERIKIPQYKEANYSFGLIIYESCFLKILKYY